MLASRAALALVSALALAMASVQAASVGGSVGAPLRHISTVVKNVRRYRHHRVPPPPPPAGVTNLAVGAVQTLTFDQVLDHFNSTDSRTWKQRYFARSDLYLQGGPAFIYIGGEGQEYSSTLERDSLFMTYLAGLFKAKLFDLEHRYYGYSHPTPDLSAKNLQYLSSDQALADLAYFIEYLIERGELQRGQKVAVFGGSYPGNLAAWARIKYPHLIHAAVSSSAPVRAEADFVEYMQVVGRSIVKKSGQNCYDNLKKATDRVAELLNTTQGMQQVKDIFRVGTDLTAKLDRDAFFETLSNPFAGAVQYNRDYLPNSAYNIKHVCSTLDVADLSVEDAMRRLAALVIPSGGASSEVYDWSYKSGLAEVQRTDYVLSDGEYGAMRQWQYQTCTEFGYYQTFDATEDVPFPRSYTDLPFYVQECKDIYGDAYTEAVLNKGVRRSNIVYGALSPDVTNVIFVNGDIDPWHALGIMKDVSKDAPAVFVDGGSHCADMNYPNPRADTESVTNAHRVIHDFLQRALYEEPISGPVE